MLPPTLHQTVARSAASCFLFILLTVCVFQTESAYLTVSNLTCEIPFQYYQQTYYDCKPSLSGRKWCAVTHADYDSYGDWDWCQEKPTADEEMCQDMRTPNVSLADVAVILKEHNRLRRYEDSSFMIKLRWSNALAKRAQFFTDTCPQSHAHMTRCNGVAVGQNMLIQKGINFHPQPQGWVRTIRDDWGEGERIKYNLTTGGCSGDGVCGHYETIIWSNTEEVGCGMSMCKSTTDTKFPYYVVYACHYSPQGRTPGVKPYERGVSCKFCSDKVYPRSYRCKERLCEICTDPKDATCLTNPCRDLVNCDEYAATFCSDINILQQVQLQMPSVYAYLKQNCQKTCKLCQSSP